MCVNDWFERTSEESELKSGNHCSIFLLSYSWDGNWDTHCNIAILCIILSMSTVA
jgi:hypothetical protein